MSLYDCVAGLELRIERIELDALSLPAGPSWTRNTGIVRLQGAGEEGVGEDVNYWDEDQRSFQETLRSCVRPGTYTLDEFSRQLDSHDLSPGALDPAGRLFRRWAAESAALDLALRQNGQSLAAVLGREARPVRFAASLGTGNPPSVAPLNERRARRPGLELKVDLGAGWTRDFVERLAGVKGIPVIDLKGHYRGAFQGPPPNAAQYGWVAELLPEAWLEDPAWDADTSAVLGPHQHRVTWDAPLHACSDLALVPVQPACVNVKPSRFGYVSELFRFYETCERRGIRMYGGGQFELGPGRMHIQYLASLFHPDMPNDVAPVSYHRFEEAAELEASPLRIEPEAAGFACRVTG